MNSGVDAGTDGEDRSIVCCDGSLVDVELDLELDWGCVQMESMSVSCPGRL